MEIIMGCRPDAVLPAMLIEKIRRMPPLPIDPCVCCQIDIGNENDRHCLQPEWWFSQVHDRFLSTANVSLRCALPTGLKRSRKVSSGCGPPGTPGVRLRKH